MLIGDYVYMKSICKESRAYVITLCFCELKGEYVYTGGIANKLGEVALHTLANGSVEEFATKVLG